MAHDIASARSNTFRCADGTQPQIPAAPYHWPSGGNSASSYKACARHTGLPVTRNPCAP